MIKVREIVKVQKWTNVSGWGEVQIISDGVIDTFSDVLQDEDLDWSWWEPNDLSGGTDYEVTVELYPADASSADIQSGLIKPLATWTCLESEMPHCKGDADVF